MQDRSHLANDTGQLVSISYGLLLRDAKSHARGLRAGVLEFQEGYTIGEARQSMQ